MSGFRNTMVQCDLCGEIGDVGQEGNHATYAQVRSLVSGWGWRSSRNVDLCSKHTDLTMHQALEAVDEKWGAS